MKLIEKLKEMFEKDRRILFAYLYGSFARKQARKGSDLDIAIFLKDTSIAERDPLFETKLSLKLEKLLGMAVEVRVINNLSLLFLHQVLKHGKLIFSRGERERISFETKVLDRYLDFLTVIKYYDEKRFERYGIR